MYFNMRAMGPLAKLLQDPGMAGTAVITQTIHRLGQQFVIAGQDETGRLKSA